MVVVMAAAGALLAMLVMVVVLVVMMMAAAALLAMLVMVMMLMLVVVTAAALAVLMMVMVLMLVLMVVIVAAAGAVLVMLVMVMMFLLLLQLGQLGGQSGLAFHGMQQLLTGQIAPGSGDDGGSGIVLSQQLHSGVQLLLGDRIGTGQDDGGGSFDLVVVELTEVLHVDLHLTGIADSHGVAQGHILIGDLFHSADHIGQLAHAGGLDDDPVRIVFGDHLLQSLAEVTHKRAADAAGVHLGDVDARLLEEAAVDTDLAELILNQDQFLARVGFLNHLFDEGGLTGTQEAGININFRHNENTFCFKIFHLALYHFLSTLTREVSVNFFAFHGNTTAPLPKAAGRT